MMVVIDPSAANYIKCCTCKGPLPLSGAALALRGAVIPPQIPLHPQQPAGPALPAAPLLPPVEQDARRILRDSLSTLPARAEHWAMDLGTAFVRLLPRLLAAIAVAGLVVLVTIWVRAALTRRRAGELTTTQRPSVGPLGALLAATAAATILGTTRLAAALLTLAVFVAAAVALQFLGERLFRRRTHIAPEAVDLVISVVRTTLLTLGVVEALAGVGLNLGGVIAGLGIVGLAFGFAAQDSLANLIAGFTILWDRPIRVGDWVRIGDAGLIGHVERLTLRTTRIQTARDGLLIIPNKDITGARLYNFSQSAGAALRIAVGIAPDTDFERARALLIGATSGDDRADAAHPPTATVVAVSDSAVTLELVVPVRDVGHSRAFRSALLERIIAAFREAGIKLVASQAPTDADRGAG
jgi:small conductance mechanosensitive channel